MRQRRLGLLGGLLGMTGLAYLVGISSGQVAVQQPAPVTAEVRAAVVALRIINTAELRYQEKYGTYGTVGQLSESGMLDNVRREMTSPLAPSDDNLGPWEQPVAGFQLALYTSTEGMHYVVFMRNDSKDPCGPSFVTSERGAILKATILDCPAR